MGKRRTGGASEETGGSARCSGEEIPKRMARLGRLARTFVLTLLWSVTRLLEGHFVRGPSVIRTRVTSICLPLAIHVLGCALACASGGEAFVDASEALHGIVCPAPTLAAKRSHENAQSSR